MAFAMRFTQQLFLSTPSARRATFQQLFRIWICVFLSTPSARRATQLSSSHFGSAEHFYPRPPRGGRPARSSPDVLVWSISIHALREEGDENIYRKIQVGDISIHALREEGDLTLIFPISFFWIFLSTPSARRATGGGSRSAARCADFYPRPPRGGRRRRSMASTPTLHFYPRPPRGGRLLCAQIQA